MTSHARLMDEALRAAGRLVLFAVIAAAVMFVLGVLLRPVFPDGLPLGRDGALAFALIAAMALALAHVLVVVFLERSDWRPTGLGPTAWTPWLLGGALVVGTWVAAAPAGLTLLAGLARLEPAPAGPWWGAAAAAVAPVLLATLTEALLFRGYAFGQLERAGGRALAIGLTSLLAALLALRVVGTPLTAGAAAAAWAALLGAVRARTGSVAAAWLMHVGAGLVVAAAFHAPFGTAALPAPAGYAWTSARAAWLTGGDGGPMDGMATALVALVVTFLVLSARRRGDPTAHR